MKLPAVFYQRNDVVQISRELLGKVLCTRLNGTVTKAIITETEAYAGVMDKASHAFGNRRTKRTETMYMAGGHAYVYLCYGIHHLFNVVTNTAEVPNAVLVRAGIPFAGEDVILKRRNRNKADANLMGGPGTISQGLGITTQLDAQELTGSKVWIEDHSIPIYDIQVGPRVGIDYAEEDALLPYRFIANLEP